MLSVKRQSSEYREKLEEIKEKSADWSGADWVIAGWLRVTCQRNKGRFYKDLWPKKDLKQSHAIMIETKMDCKIAKRQSCN